MDDLRRFSAGRGMVSDRNSLVLHDHRDSVRNRLFPFGVLFVVAVRENDSGRTRRRTDFRDAPVQCNLVHLRRNLAFCFPFADSRGVVPDDHRDSVRIAAHQTGIRRIGPSGQACGLI